MSSVDRRADAAARLRAQTVFDRPVVVEAGAGTGKTTTLTGRVVGWLMGPGWARAAPGRESDEDVAATVLEGVVAITSVSYTHLTLPTNREV